MKPMYKDVDNALVMYPHGTFYHSLSTQPYSSSHYGTVTIYHYVSPEVKKTRKYDTM